MMMMMVFFIIQISLVFVDVFIDECKRDDGFQERKQL